jgi:hypothetical protein
LACLVPPGLEPLSGRISASYALGRRPHPYRGSARGLVSPGSQLRPAQQCTAGDRCEPLGSDGVWTKRGPGMPRLWGQRRSASRILASKGDPAGCPRQASPTRAIALLGGAMAGSGPGTSPLYRGLSLVTAVVVPSTLRVQTTRTMVGAWAIWHHEPDRLRLGRWDSNPVPCCFASRGRGGEWPLTFYSHSPTVTVRVRREPAVSDVVRTQRGPRS